MKATVAAAESVRQSSVRSLPRRFGDLNTEVTPLDMSATERKLCLYDGGSEIDLLKAVAEEERTEAQKEVLEAEDAETWCRPCLDLRDLSGSIPETNTETATKPKESVYGKRICGLCCRRLPCLSTP